MAKKPAGLPELQIALGKALASQGTGAAFSQRLENRIIKLRAKIKAYY